MYQPNINIIPETTDIEEVIIGPAQYESDFTDFIKWKSLKGVKTVYKTTESIYDEYPQGDNWHPHPITDLAGRIRAYLKDMYTNHCLSYAIIVGGGTDVDQSPNSNDEFLTVRYCCVGNNSWKATGNIEHWAPYNVRNRVSVDLYFSDFDGDYNVEGDANGYYGELDDIIQNGPEIFVGRILATPQDDISPHEKIRRWVEKTITYETNPGFGDDSYLMKNFMNTGLMSEYNDYYVYAGTLSNEFSNFTGGTTYLHARHGWPTGSMTIQRMREGFGLINWYEHGMKYFTSKKNGVIINNKWYGYNVTSLDSYPQDCCQENGNGFDNLLANGKYGILYSVSCMTAKHDDTSGSINDFSDPWADLICMAESYTCYTEGMGGPAMIANTHDGFRVLSENIEKYFLQQIFNNQVYNAGRALATAKQIASEGRLLDLSTTYFGDPEMDMWTSIPLQMTVAFDHSSNSVHVSYNGNPLDGASVVFTNQNGDGYLRTYTNASGIATCTFDYRDICITKHDFKPYIKRIGRNSEVISSVTDQKWDFIIPSGRTVTLQNSLNLSSFGGKNAKIVVENGGTFILAEGSMLTGEKTTFTPDEFSSIRISIPGNCVEVYGTLNINNGAVVAGITNWDGIRDYSNGTLDIDQALFNNCPLYKENGYVNIYNSYFVDSPISMNRASVEIKDCSMLSGVYCTGSELVKIENNTENPCYITGLSDGITLINCGVTNIYGYTITGNVRNGINLHESYGRNTIENCSIISNSQDGIRMYHSSARIIGCQISGNQKGVIAYRGSNVEILKDPNSAPWFHDSCITNNTWMEILFTDDCDLQMARGMNKILDAPYNPDTFDKYLVFCPNMTRSRDLGLNYWGSDPQGLPIYPEEERFEPACINPSAFEIGFNLNPLWNPGPPSVITWENDELIYHNAIDLALAEDTVGAVALFKNLISQFPESDFAPASAKNLLALEEDKQALKDYYATEPNLHWNGEIDKLADYLENYCNIKMGDYQAAISWFEDIISDPECELDSLMAVIDLGYVYLLMQENSPKAQITCQYPQLVPKSRTQYEQKTNAILTALYSPANGANQEDGTNTIPILPQIPVLHNNYPNPFNPSTSISFSLPADMQCSLSIYNIKGQKVKTLQSGISTQGNHTLIWNGRDDNGKPVSSGVYFYQLKAQDKTITKKMIMVK